MEGVKQGEDLEEAEATADGSEDVEDWVDQWEPLLEKKGG